MIDIHPTSVVDRNARLGEDVVIGPNCFVGPRVVLGDRCRLHNNVTITGSTTIGCENEFFPNVVIGCTPQDLKYRGGDTQVIIGSGNVFRENVTVNAGTELGGGVTRVGDHNRFLVGVHLGHDVQVGSDCIISNYVQLAGHSSIEDRVTMGGMIGIHNFVTIGRYAYVAGFVRITVDVPPYMITGGEPARVRGVNTVGMSRWQFDAERIERLREAFKLLFSRRALRGGGSLLEKVAALESNGAMNDDLRYLCEFLRRSTCDGVYGRYRESLRTDTAEDRGRFYREGVAEAREAAP